MMVATMYGTRLLDVVLGKATFAIFCLGTLQSSEMGREQCV